MIKKGCPVTPAIIGVNNEIGRLQIKLKFLRAQRKFTKREIQEYSIQLRHKDKIRQALIDKELRKK